MAFEQQQHQGRIMSGEDAAVAASGAVVITASWWWEFLAFVPEGLKFIGLVVTVIYLTFRAMNEVAVFINRIRGGDSNDRMDDKGRR